MKQIKIRDKEYNCSNRIYYHIQGLESENRVISMELLGHENNELQQQKEIERLKREKDIVIKLNHFLAYEVKRILEDDDLCHIEKLQEIAKVVGVDKE